MPAKLQDIEVFVDEHARRRVAREQDVVDIALDIERRAQKRGLLPWQPPELAGRGKRQRRTHAGLAGVDPCLGVDRGEQRVEVADRLRAPEQEEPILVEGIVDDRDHALLERRAKIDQEVPAAHEVELRERWIGDEVVASEHAALADVLLDPVAAILAAEELFEPLGAHL